MGELVGLGGLFWALANSKNDDFKSTPQTDPKARGLKSSVAVWHLLAISSFLRALQQRRWGLLYLLWRPSPTATDVLRQEDGLSWERTTYAWRRRYQRIFVFERWEHLNGWHQQVETIAQTSSGYVFDDAVVWGHRLCMLVDA
ncbi:MAG: hypothetical protein R3C68_00835 [Myxococcota bacterium]